MIHDNEPFQRLELMRRSDVPLECSLLPCSSLWVWADYRFKQAACGEDLPAAPGPTSRSAALLPASEWTWPQWNLATRLILFEARPSLRMEGKGQPRRPLEPAAMEAGQGGK